MLRYLDAVARLGSIRKAAAELNVASSAINRQIIALEQDIGEPIFERMPRRLRLTSTGELLIQHVRDTLKAHDETMWRIASMRGLKWGQVTLAVSLGLSVGPMAEIVANYLAANPRMNIRVTGGITETVANAVINGDVTLGFAYGLTPRPALRTIFAADLPLGILVAPDHPLVGRPRVHLQNILDYPLVMAEPGMSLRAATDLALSRFPDVPPPVLETNSIGLMRNFVARFHAVALLNPLDVVADLQEGKLVFLPVQDENLHPQTVRLVCRSRDAMDATASHFANHLAAHISTLVDRLTAARPLT